MFIYPNLCIKVHHVYIEHLYSLTICIQDKVTKVWYKSKILTKKTPKLMVVNCKHTHGRMKLKWMKLTADPIQTTLESKYP